MSLSRTKIAFVLPVVVALALAATGCGSDDDADSASSSPAVTEPQATEPAVTPTDAQGGEEVGARADALCADFIETVGSLETPEGEDDLAAFEEQLAAAEQAYRDGLAALPAAAEDQALLAELVQAHEDFAEARASSRAERNPEGPEQTEGAAAAAAKAEELAAELGITGCAGV